MRLRLSSSKKQEGVQEKTGLQAEKSGQMSAASSKDGKPGLFSRKRERRACNESFRILGFYTSSGSPLPPIPAHWYSKPTVLEPPPLASRMVEKTFCERQDGSWEFKSVVSWVQDLAPGHCYGGRLSVERFTIDIDKLDFKYGIHRWPKALLHLRTGSNHSPVLA
uniref:Uncharacterized protein n=1 Tax=Bionectria ochroleuca TaxID=29856 RepID=A0A8H7NLJ9_BIOOC